MQTGVALRSRELATLELELTSLNWFTEGTAAHHEMAVDAGNAER